MGAKTLEPTYKRETTTDHKLCSSRVTTKKNLSVTVKCQHSHSCTTDIVWISTMCRLVIISYPIRNDSDSLNVPAVAYRRKFQTVLHYVSGRGVLPARESGECCKFHSGVWAELQPQTHFGPIAAVQPKNTHLLASYTQFSAAEKNLATDLEMHHTRCTAAYATDKY